MEERRKKVAAKGDITRTAGSGSQTSEREAKPLSAEANYRQKAMAMPAKQ